MHFKFFIKNMVKSQLKVIIEKEHINKMLKFIVLYFQFM